MTQFDKLDGQLSDAMLDMREYLAAAPELRGASDRLEELSVMLRMIMTDVAYTPDPNTPEGATLLREAPEVEMTKAEKPNSAAPMHTCKKGGWSMGLRADCSHC
tara:strand:+ start:26612 stop:26923 length:312 start_codon:yes stop_codon:yes gene_type:complete